MLAPMDDRHRFDPGELHLDAFHLGEGIALLERTPRVLHTLLDGLPACWSETRPAPDAWTPREVVAHLIHGERTDWLPRARHILQHGASVPFDPFDRAGHAADAERPLPELLATFAALRAESLAALQSLHLQPADLDRTGRHPALGPVTLRQLLATWVLHDLNHEDQILRAMAQRWGLHAGPWNNPDFLGILHRRK